VPARTPTGPAAASPVSADQRRTTGAPGPGSTVCGMTTTTVAPSTTHTKGARREITVFLVLQAVFLTLTTSVAVAEGADVTRVGEATALGQAALYGSAVTVFVAALIARLSTRSRAGWGFRRFPLRAGGLAWAVGVAIVLAAYGVIWLTGVGTFDPAGIADGLGTASAVVAGLLALTVLVVPYTVLALAEDVGWRGLLVTRLAEFAGPRTVVLVSGVAWSLFHTPLILWLGGTPEGVSPLYAVAVFAVGTTALGAILAWTQLRWGIWPGVILHGAFNAALYHLAEPGTVAGGRGFGWIATETGLAIATATTVAAVVWLRRAPLVRDPATGGTRAAMRRTGR
jgi:uncharacterized protein